MSQEQSSPKKQKMHEDVHAGWKALGVVCAFGNEMEKNGKDVQAAVEKAFEVVGKHGLDVDELNATDICVILHEFNTSEYKDDPVVMKCVVDALCNPLTRIYNFVGKKDVKELPTKEEEITCTQVD